MSGHDDPQTALNGPGGAGSVEPFGWMKAHPSPERFSGPRPGLTPEEFSEAPLTAEERRRRVELLVRLREANHPYC